MYKNIGINKTKERTKLVKKIKMPKRPSCYYNYVKKFDIYDDLEPDYTFEDMRESVLDCMDSDDDECCIKSCILDKKFNVDKKVLIAAGVGAVAAGVGLSILGIQKHNKKNTKKKAKTKISRYAPTLVKVATKFI